MSLSDQIEKLTNLINDPYLFGYLGSKEKTLLKAVLESLRELNEKYE
jgi:hypothetical protein